VNVVYLTLLACAAAAALLVVRYDLYEREPWPMLIAAAAVGATVMWSIGFLEDATLARCGGPTAGPPVLAVIAAVEEELARLAIVVLIALLLPRQLNDPIDGLIYGSMVGLGMAVEESREVLSWMDPTWLLPGTEPVRLLGHLVLGGITGFAIGMARLAMPGWKLALAQCVALSIGIHFLWDWIAFIVRDRGLMTPAQTIGAVGLMITGMVVYGVLVVRGSRRSREIFAPGSTLDPWGWPFAGHAADGVRQPGG
jgi:RsiW-degrading membrane proteinase PrsW (M82 family)